MDKTIIKPFKEQDLKIYAYTLPEIPNHEGCIKVGETSRTVEDRVAEQTKILGLNPNILFKRKAKKHTGEWFHDKELHRYFILNNIPKKDFGTGSDEWFYFNSNLEMAEELTDKFIANDYDAIGIEDEKYDYILRKEQKIAVEDTYEYYKNPIHGPEFLWNAKPRFGKTLTTYDFIRKINATNILIVTNRPAIANSWNDDFVKFIGWQEPKIKFISDTEALKDKVMTRDDFVNYTKENIDKEEKIGSINFISLQDLKGARIFGGMFDKLEWVANIEWDLLVIDEAHEGIDTLKTDKLFDKINRKFTLHLSGTPFKAIANNKFNIEQIYNWSYVDEQTAKENWDESLGTNPYSNLPTLSLFTYQMSKMIEEKASEGIKISEENNIDYTFDLNEFFRTRDNGTFVYEESVMKFLDNLTENKFPFAESEYRYKLNHTFWLLPRVAACKAMEKLLKKHSVFSDYKTILAAGDGISLEEDIDETVIKSIDDLEGNEKSFDKVRKAIKNNERTITLSVGQLTTGVTIPEWTGVFMLSNIKSPSLYFQAAFRSQNPYEFKDDLTGELLRKENSYIFDFAPERTLTLFDEFANNLSVSGASGTSDIRKKNIKELLNFFPVIGEDENGVMHELDANEVLTIPNKIKSQEVVERGFMSNLLFTNISAIFRAPEAMKEILEKIQPEKNKRLGNKEKIEVTDPMINEEGEIYVDKDIVINKTKDIFGDKIYTEDIKFEYGLKDTDKESKEISTSILDKTDLNLDTLKESFELNKTQLDRVKRDIRKKLEDNIKEKIEIHKEAIIEIEENHYKEIKDLPVEEKNIKKEELKIKTKEIEKQLQKEINNATEEVFQQTVKKEIVKQEEKKKKTTEDKVRDHLRGFARTIPAFLMAYADDKTTLQNFDKIIDEKTFEELTSITLEEFRVLRDGMIIEDEHGVEKDIPGLFNEVVFNSSIEEFMKLKEKLADYLEGNLDEDIFDYIPPQETNQIFTPRFVVKTMVDILEKENKELFSNKHIKFIDLYSKSGLYTTEIIKKLNEGLKKEIPEDRERIKWIMENQVYACAPSNIIYNMVKNYVYEGYEYVDNKNLLELDLSQYVENETVEAVFKEKWGENMKFDVIIGNPPYQEGDGGAQASARPIYQYFVQEAKKLNPKYISLITPSRWYVGGKGLDQFREEMLNDIHLEELHDWLTPADIFPNTNIRGGVSYFLWNKDYDNTKDLVRVVTYKDKKVISDKKRPLKLDGVDIFVRDSIGCAIFSKISKEDKLDYVASIVSPLRPFGFRGYFINDKEFRDNSVGLKDYVICYARGWTKGYVDKKLVNVRTEYIDNWKIFTPRANNIGTELPDDNLNTKIGKPGEICTESYLMVGHNLDLTEVSVKALDKYLKTKFLRFLHGLAKGSQDATAKTYRFVPLQDFTDASDIDWNKSIDDIDEQLFDKYNLNEEERKHIKESIKKMN